MDTLHKKTALALLTIMLPISLLAAQAPLRENLSGQIKALSIFNIILFITSLVSIVQFFLRDGHNRTPFQLFNIAFAAAFYFISITFLFNHKEYFDGYENLSDKDAIIKYFMDKDFITWLKLLIPVAVLLNIIYVIRNARSYYLE